MLESVIGINLFIIDSQCPRFDAAFLDIIMFFFYKK